MKNSFKSHYLNSQGLARFTFGIHYLFELLSNFDNDDFSYVEIIKNKLDDIDIFTILSTNNLTYNILNFYSEDKILKLDMLIKLFEPQAKVDDQMKRNIESEIVKLQLSLENSHNYEREIVRLDTKIEAALHENLFQEASRLIEERSILKTKDTFSIQSEIDALNRKLSLYISSSPMKHQMNEENSFQTSYNSFESSLEQLNENPLKTRYLSIDEFLHILESLNLVSTEFLLKEALKEIGLVKFEIYHNNQRIESTIKGESLGILTIQDVTSKHSILYFRSDRINDLIPLIESYILTL